MKALVGYTGFVGSNLDHETFFDGRYNSKNIQLAFGTHPDLLVYAGLPAEKYLANKYPEKDLKKILQAEENIKKINPKKLVLISTIDVFSRPVNVNESTAVDLHLGDKYGFHRYLLEKWVRENYSDALIVRLPGLFGQNIKKNFIYDYIHKIPFRLDKGTFNNLNNKDATLETYYYLNEDGYYQCKTTTQEQEQILKEKFKALDFSALKFTDSRGIYQFYPLKRLWSDICTAIHNNLYLWHPATEPINIGELYFYLEKKSFKNIISAKPAHYDYHTQYAQIFNGRGHYIMDKSSVMYEIKRFIQMVAERKV